MREPWWRFHCAGGTRAGIEIDAADPRGMAPKVHLLDDAGSGSKVENDGGGGEMLENALAE
ncbi:MAG: hypothetical protein V9H25_05125 [Candidatus Competibacter sp.]